ncbi:MAG: hypothetical protein M3Q30_07490 [Actinomycetota bacterium]|nr:hypothetical protein [Actinomycetota bacterium]
MTRDIAEDPGYLGAPGVDPRECAERGLTRRTDGSGRGGSAARVAALLVAALLLASTAGCASGARTAAVDVVVPVGLANFKITLPAHVRAGVAKFALTGFGPSMHELVIARTDASPSRLPLAADGTVDESGHAGFDRIAEREGIDIGGHSSLTVRLYPGHYVVFCNMYGHYEAGMRAEVTVT